MVLHISYLRYLRRKNHITMTEAAKRLGVSKATLSRYENAETEVKASILLKMADLYKVSLEDLLKREEKN